MRAFVAILCALLVAAPAYAGPINSYPVAGALSAGDAMIGTQAGVTVQITAARMEAFTSTSMLGASNTWTGSNTFQGKILCGTGTAQTDVGQIVACSAPAPPLGWASYISLYDAHRFDIGGFPVNDELFGNTYSLSQSLVGTLDVPSNANANGGSAAAGNGVAGYCISFSTHQGCVGAFGFGGLAADGVSGWGGNVIGQNCPGASSCATNTGYNGNVWGLEADMNILLRGGVAPTLNARDFHCIGASETTPTGIFTCLDIDNPGIGHGLAPWKTGIQTEDGAALVAFQVGVLATGNNHPSQPVNFSSRTSGGTLNTSQIFSTAAGDFVFQSSANGAAILSPNGGPCTLAAASGFDAAGCVMTAPFFRPNIQTLAQLNTADAFPVAGDRAAISDAVSCTANSTVSGTGSTTCAVLYSGSAWKAEVTH